MNREQSRQEKKRRERKTKEVQKKKRKTFSLDLSETISIGCCHPARPPLLCDHREGREAGGPTTLMAILIITVHLHHHVFVL